MKTLHGNKHNRACFSCYARNVHYVDIIVIAEIYITVADFAPIMW